MVRLVLQLQKDEMRARAEPSTAPHFVRGYNVRVVTKNFFLRGQPSRQLRDRQLGPFIAEEQIGKHNYKFKLPSRVRLHPMSHVNNLRPYCIALLCFVVSVTAQEDDEEFDVSHIYTLCIKSSTFQRGNTCC
jgi:hypothetical protein